MTVAFSALIKFTMVSTQVYGNGTERVVLNGTALLVDYSDLLNSFYYALLPGKEPPCHFREIQVTARSGGYM